MMNERQLEFRSHLMKKIKASRLMKDSDILTHLSNFSKTPEFQEAFEKWDKATKWKNKKFRPRQIFDILQESLHKGRK